MTDEPDITLTTNEQNDPVIHVEGRIIELRTFLYQPTDGFDNVSRLNAEIEYEDMAYWNLDGEESYPWVSIQPHLVSDSE